MCGPKPDLLPNKLDSRGRETARVNTLPLRYRVRTLSDVTVKSSTVEKQGSDAHVVYAVIVSQHDEQWTVHRRYRQFLNLHTKLTKLYGITLEFPERIYFNNRDPAVIQQREAALNSYIKGLLDIDRVKESPEFRTFVGAEIDLNSNYTQFSYAFRSGRQLND
ncbi:hypothetical protein THRCLA_05035 [Thraustotheca clavata]|uniref:PX domain-containing protein n=1 Tax=Thraustotheca clavata TaxID=74557 RepID=A0A1V9ZXD6_9STRA|nr:hypothetical protein THRCLA_05035 [Thraustotheca clavata]